LFEDATSRSEVVCTFLALLELIRLKQLVCGQSEDFGEIEIKKRADTLSAPLDAPDVGQASRLSQT
jgi:chromatin segregation and condensation protein Rec8/ScpA/Scc1 (kleisin family)